MGHRLALATLLVLPAADALAQSCAMCASSFGENDPMSRAISWSILFMMGMPYAIFGTIAGIVFWTHRRSGRPRAAIIDFGKAARLLGRSLPGRSKGDLA